MKKSNDRYVPALGRKWLTLLYDPVLALTAREHRFKELLIRQASIKDGDHVLDLGCGTGTLTIWAKGAVPGARVVGIDGDEKVLSIGKEKARKTGVDIEFDHGLSFQLPYPDCIFDLVVSSLFFHHLRKDDKLPTVREVVRVLKPGGRLHVADWGKPSNPLMRVLFYQVQLLDGFDNTKDNVEGLLPRLFEEGGLEEVSLRTKVATVYGTIQLYSGNKPSTAR